VGKNVEINYSTSSFAGTPQLTYRSGKKTRTFRGAEIRSEETAIGRLVTVTIEDVKDAFYTTLSLLVPRINGEEATLSTGAILTRHRTSIGGPGLVKGAVESYTAFPLKGTARLVDY